MRLRVAVQAAEREQILQLVARLEAGNPLPEPTRHLERLAGSWQVLFSTIPITVRLFPVTQILGTLQALVRAHTVSCRSACQHLPLLADTAAERAGPALRAPCYMCSLHAALLQATCEDLVPALMHYAVCAA